jgi:hypothetical protein
MSKKVIKKITGDASFYTEQQFSSVEDAFNEVNPLTEAIATVTDVKISNKKIRVEEELNYNDRTRQQADEIK